MQPRPGMASTGARARTSRVGLQRAHPAPAFPGGDCLSYKGILPGTGELAPRE